VFDCLIVAGMWSVNHGIEAEMAKATHSSSEQAKQAKQGTHASKASNCKQRKQEKQRKQRIQSNKPHPINQSSKATNLKPQINH
jgi:hypothetical protein